MTEQEKFNAEVQIRLAKQDAKFELFMHELQQQREDIRHAQAQHNADMKEMREDIKGTLRHIQGLTIAAMVGIVAIAGATWAFMWSSSRNVTPPTNPPAQSAHVADNLQP